MRLVILAIAWTWAAAWAVAGLAQVPLSKPDVPLLTNGTVRAVAPLADGSVIIGGDFSHVNSVPRANLAKLAPDGTLDPNWAPQTNDYVQALALDDFGNVFVGGNFTEVNGQSRGFLAKLSASGTGALDPQWTLPVYGSVNTVVVDGVGDVMIGGNITQVGTTSRLRIAKLSGAGAGTVNATWDPSADGVVTVIAFGPGGSILVAGQFNNIGGQARHNLAKVAGLGTGQADPTWNPGVDDRIEALATDASGNVYAAGYFQQIGGASRTNVARLSGSGTGAADPTWIPQVLGYTSDLSIGPDGMIYVVGDFVVVSSLFVGGIARLSPTTAAADPNWRPLGADSSALAIRFAPNGDAVIGGAFREIEDQEAAGYVRIDADAGAEVVATASTDMPGNVRAVLRQTDGGLVVGGRFWKAGSVRRNNLARFLPNGALDLNWNPSVEGGDFTFVYALADDTSQRVYIGGSYDTIGGMPRNGLARYSAAGVLDPTWNPQPNGPVSALATAADGSVYVGGQFSQIGGQPRANIAKLAGTGNGSAVVGWDGSADERVYTLALAPNGDVYAGGGFTNIGGQIRHFLARLSGTTGAADLVWQPFPDDWVYDILVGAADSVYVGGAFNMIGAETRNHLARIFAAGSGTLYASWNPAADDRVWALARDTQGNIYVGGDFDNVGGAFRRGIAKLTFDTGLADPQWNPSILGGINNRRVLGLAASADRLDVVGSFVATGGRTRIGVASFSTKAGFLFSDSFE